MADLSNFHTYKGQYLKAYVDLILNDGTLVARCWPNDGTFYDAERNQTISEEDVAQIRRSADQSPTIKTGRVRRFGGRS